VRIVGVVGTDYNRPEIQQSSLLFRQLNQQKLVNNISINTGGMHLMRKSTLLFLILIASAITACGGGSEAAEPVGKFSCSPSGTTPHNFDGPEQVISSGHEYTATITMEKGGEIVLELFPDEAPITVNNFVFLACQGFYDGLTFHRVIPNFVAQGGDPSGTGSGGPGYTIEHEADNGVPFDQPYLISMAHRMTPNSTGSQFFITYAPLTQLDADFTVFGRVMDGTGVVDGILPRNPEDNPDYTGDVIAKIRVEEH
jgi:peptidylprolyl isomerase